MFHLADRQTSYAKPGEAVIWNALPDTLSFIAENVQPGDRTLEIGSGATTVVFAAAGAAHTAISPVPHEHDRIGEYCRSIGVPVTGVSFIGESSDAVLPGLSQSEQLDFALIDGTHAFPYAVVEWHYLRRLLRPGGILVLDDVPIPAVAPVYRFLRADPDWSLIRHLDRRTAAFMKLRETPPGQTWRDQAFNAGYPDYSFLPLAERIPTTVRARKRAARAALGRRLPVLRRFRRKLRQT